MGPIPWDAMEAYAQRKEYEGEEYEAFITIMEGLDQIFLAETAPKATKKNNTAGQ